MARGLAALLAICAAGLASAAAPEGGLRGGAREAGGRGLAAEASCNDTAGGATAMNNQTCENFTENPQACLYADYYDDDDFTATDLCCACGGGNRVCEDTSEGANFSFGEGGPPGGPSGGDCDFWWAFQINCAEYSGFYDDTDFTAMDMCCACGGGQVATDPPTYAPTPATDPPTYAPTSMPEASTTAEAAQTSGAAGTSEPPEAAPASTSVAATTQGAEDARDDSGSLRAGHALCPLAACLLVAFSVRQL